MLTKVAVFGFVGLMMLGATCNEQNSEPEAIARCIDPRRIDFDHGYHKACETLHKVAHPLESVGSAFERRLSPDSVFPPVHFQDIEFGNRRFGN